MANRTQVSICIDDLFAASKAGHPAITKSTKNNNTTYADVTGVAFSIAANASYSFTILIHAVTNTTAGYKFTLTGPAAPTAVAYGAAPYVSGGSLVASVTAFSSDVALVPATSGRHLLYMSGTIRNGANAGTVQLQFAQNVADASNSIVYAESSVMAWRVA